MQTLQDTINIWDDQLSLMEKQAEFVEKWGFTCVRTGDTNIFVRQAPEGYVEHWLESCPDYIMFVKDSHITHTYKIDWKLFIKSN